MKNKANITCDCCKKVLVEYEGFFKKTHYDDVITIKDECVSIFKDKILIKRHFCGNCFDWIRHFAKEKVSKTNTEISRELEAETGD